MHAGLLLALGLPLLGMASAQANSSAPAEPAAPTYRELRPLLPAALEACRPPQRKRRCAAASQLLSELIAISEQPYARAHRPRCLGALALLETHVTVFRWGFQPRQRLQAAIPIVEQACPYSTLSAAPAAAN